MKIAITGASGFLGRYILEELDTKLLNIIAVTRNFQKQLPVLAKGKWITLDITNPPENAFELMGRPDILIHLAWDGLPNYKSLHHVEKELPQQYAFLKQIVEHGLKSLVITGTCFEYGMQSGLLNEDIPPKPSNPYGSAKNALCHQLQCLQRTSAFNLTWARLFYIYGDGQADNSLWPQLKRAVADNKPRFNMSGGEQVRDYLPVRKVAKYLVQLAIKRQNMGLVNICSGQPIRIKTLVESWVRENNWSIKLNLGYYPYPDYEPMEFWGDPSKLLSILKPMEST